MTNAERVRFEQALKDFQNALEKYKFAPDSSDEHAAKISYYIGVCFYHLGGLNDAVARSEAAIKLSENKYGQAFHALGIAEGEIGNREAA